MSDVNLLLRKHKTFPNLTFDEYDTRILYSACINDPKNFFNIFKKELTNNDSQSCDSNDIIGIIKDESDTKIGQINSHGYLSFNNTNTTEHFSSHKKMFHKFSLKKLKDKNTQLQDLKTMKFNKNHSIIGQIVDKNKKNAKGIIVSDESNSHKLILIKEVEIFPDVPIYAILDTKL